MFFYWIILKGHVFIGIWILSICVVNDTDTNFE